MMVDRLWSPSEERIASSELTRYLGFLSEKRGLEFGDHEALWRWSVDDRETFWASLWEFFDIVASRESDQVLMEPDDMLASKWFPEARLNFAENLLRHSSLDADAIVLTAEDGSTTSMSFSELEVRVARTASSLRDDGIGIGDRVAGFMPNIIETVVAMLATTSIGAVWSSCSPDFGIKGVYDRFGQIEPKVLFCADGYLYNGKRFDSIDKVKGIQSRLPSLERTVVVPFTGDDPDIGGMPGTVTFDHYLGGGKAPGLEFEQLPFDHPGYIMYSSGTTGVPKCIVHGAGGTLIQHMKEHALHTDIRKGDRVFYFTTCGWMMWNWLVSSLALGSTLLLFDGNPFHPDPGRLFKLADDQRMTMFGTSARYVDAVEKAGYRPAVHHHLDSVRTMCSTGSPLSVESFHFVYDHIKSDIQLASISGGTDIISCFALGSPVLPVHAGELQTRGLGMSVDSFDEMGNSMRGSRGELVCTRSFPSQPVYFWNDPGDKGYRGAYFDRFPGIWHHGDYVEITENHGMIFYGRSDTTLNPGGVRIGTAEIYRPVMMLDAVNDAIVVGQRWDGDVRIVLFVVLRSGTELDDGLRKEIRTVIRRNASPRHVPAKVIQVPDIPRTISGKKVELAVQKVIHGEAVSNRDALGNPEALEHFKDLVELED